MRVFVSDATGVLGRALVLRLVADRHVVRAIASGSSRAFAPPGVDAVDADLLADDLVELVRGCDAVVHVARDVPPCAVTRRLLDAAVACGVPRYVQQSSTAVYRDGGDRWLGEDAPVDDLIELETAVHRVDARSLAWTILRGGSLVGAGTLQDALVARLRTGGEVVAGDGSNYVSPLNVADMASAVIAALARAPAGSTFNVVDQPLRYSDYVDALADLIGVERPRRGALPLPASRRCANTPARLVLGWSPRHSIWPSP